jgi:hypothetical protein
VTQSTAEIGGPTGWEIGVTAGADELGSRRRTFRTIAGTRTDADKALASLVTESGDRTRIPQQTDRQLTGDDLVEWYMQFAREDRSLDHPHAGHEHGCTRWLQKPLGGKRARSLVSPTSIERSA